MTTGANKKEESLTKTTDCSGHVEPVVSRIDGYYVCEVSYDMYRGIFWYQSETETFHNGNTQASKQDFTYISKEPIDLYDEKLWDMESCQPKAKRALTPPFKQ